jgi:uncharacterized membrane protein
VAGIAAAVLPAAAAALFLWLFPAGCDLRGDPATYRWACLLPGLMISGSWLLALFLAAVSYVRRGAATGLLRGFLAMTVGAGLLVHLVLVGAYLLLLDPVYRALGTAELLFMPQLFCAGAIGGAVFWITREVAQNSRSMEAQR